MNVNSGENAYTILETLHRSKHYCVYKARNYFRGTLVTIKTIDQQFRADSAINRQLRHEAEAGMRLHHPAIRQAQGLFEDDGNIYMVSEYIEGDSLSALLSLPKVEISYEHASRWVSQLLEALEYAHTQRIIHINLNPQNIIITPNYDLKVIGFGKFPGAWKTAESEKSEPHPIFFTAPEVFLEGNPDERSDVYSIGVLAYLLYTGHLPWSLTRHEPPSQLKQQTLTRPLLNPELRGRSMPPWLFSVINKCMMVDSGKRCASVTEIKESIAQKREYPYASCVADTINMPTTDRPTEAAISSSETKKPLPAVSPASYQVRQPLPKRKEDDSKEDLGRMVKVFRVLMIFSLLIIAYIIVKYVLLRDDPQFKESEGVEEATALPGDQRMATKTCILKSENSTFMTV